MTEDITYVAKKLERWERYLHNYRLPDWNEIPDIGLFMDQVITLLTQYLDYLPPELKADSTITPAAINNYVRMKIMPKPRKKRYYRLHIACLLMICIMKQTLSISLVQQLIPTDLPQEEFEATYRTFTQQHRSACADFTEQVREETSTILHGTATDEQAVNHLVFTLSIRAGFTKLLVEKLILLDNSEA